VNVEFPMRVVVPSPALELWNVVVPICVLTKLALPPIEVKDVAPIRCVVPDTPLLNE
jgi:hypothetical protein